MRVLLRGRDADGEAGVIEDARFKRREGLADLHKALTKGAKTV